MCVAGSGDGGVFFISFRFFIAVVAFIRQFVSWRGHDLLRITKLFFPCLIRACSNSTSYAFLTSSFFYSFLFVCFFSPP